MQAQLIASQTSGKNAFIFISSCDVIRPGKLKGVITHFTDGGDLLLFGYIHTIGKKMILLEEEFRGVCACMCACVYVCKREFKKQLTSECLNHIYYLSF